MLCWRQATARATRIAGRAVAFDEALKEAGAFEQKAQAAAQATVDDKTRSDKLETKIDSGFAEVKAEITMLEWMNGIVIGGVSALIKTFST